MWELLSVNIVYCWCCVVEDYCQDREDKVKEDREVWDPESYNTRQRGATRDFPPFSQVLSRQKSIVKVLHLPSYAEYSREY